MKAPSLLTAALAFAACSSASNLATDRNHAGSGSSALSVRANITASLTSGGPVTSFQVNLGDGFGNSVSGATVTISSSDLGDVPLVEATAGSGQYVNSKTSFPSGDFTLAITRNTDSIKGVVVGNPGAHTINAPARSAVVPANQPLQTSWTTPLVAKSVSIQTKDFQADAIDNGAYTIPGNQNPARANQHLIISRINETDIAAALPGSRLRVTFTATVDPYTVQ